jgi:hypothetical protein
MQDVNALIGKFVRNTDGRHGQIAGEALDASKISLDILDDSGRRHAVHLNSDGPDNGATGWSWNVAEPGEPDYWVLLGDHNLCMT